MSFVALTSPNAALKCLAHPHAEPSPISVPTMTIPNHFAALLDPVAILSACAQSGALSALPVSVRRSADRTSHKVAGELAEHDAAIDELYRELIAKASKTPPPQLKGVLKPEGGASSAEAAAVASLSTD